MSRPRAPTTSRHPAQLRRAGLRRRRRHRHRAVQTTPRQRPLSQPGRVQHHSEQNAAAVEHAIAHLKTWWMLSEEGGRYRAPIGKYKSVVKAVVGLFFFKAYE
jgi:hypothetical protein